MFAPGDSVDVVGMSKGKGFQGVVKRHHFRGGAATHGSMFHRAPGGIGASAFPSRVIKGMRAAGHMGSDRVTVRNLKVVRVDAGEQHAGGAGRGARGRRRLRGHPQEQGDRNDAWPRRRRRTAPSKAPAAKAAAPRRQRRRPRRQGAAQPAQGLSEGRHRQVRAAAGPGRPARDGDRSRWTTPRTRSCATSPLHPEVFGVRVNEHLLYEAVKQYRAGARARHPRDQEPRPGLRLGQEALAAEGHRPRPRRRDPHPALAARRHRLRPQPRDYSYHVPKKARVAALRSALSQRVQGGGAQGGRPLRRSRRPRRRS